MQSGQTDSHGISPSGSHCRTNGTHAGLNEVSHIVSGIWIPSLQLEGLGCRLIGSIISLEVGFDNVKTLTILSLVSLLHARIQDISVQLPFLKPSWTLKPFGTINPSKGFLL